MKILSFITRNWMHIRTIGLLALLFGVSYQMLIWKSFAFQVSYLQLKQMVWVLGPEDLKDYGSICNSLEKWDCSEELFGEWARRFPGSQLALANYGIALGRQKKWQRSANVFRRYFKRGGTAFDAMLWHARTLNQLVQPEKALQWYYRSLSVSPGNVDVATSLVDHLVIMGRFEEALSVIASFTRGVPDRNPFWSTKASTIKKYQAESGAEDKNPLITKLRLPSLVGRAYFLPVKAGTESGFQFFLIDQRQEDIVMTEDVLANLIQSGSAASEISLGKAIQWGKVRLSQLQLGPWSLQNIEVTLCRKCQPRLGQAILEHVTMELHKEDSTEFLLLSRR